jgi:hypothetical protein
VPFPITLPPHHVGRLIDRQASVLILPRQLQLRGDGHPNLFEVHNAQQARRNARHDLQGHPEKREDPCVFVVEILEVTAAKLRDLDAETVRAAGYASWRDLHEDWQRRHQGVDVEIEVHVHQFKIVEARFLHERVHKGYAVDPSAGARGEPQAIGERELDEMAVANRARFEAGRGDEMRRRKAKNLKRRLDTAVKQMDSGEIAKLSRELAILSAEVASAA